MTTSLSLAHMVDLALGTPEVGAVNFNVLHTLLHALIKKLDLQDYATDINEADKDFLSRNSAEKSSENNNELVSDLSGKAPDHILQAKLEQLEQQLAVNDLPSNDELLSKMRQGNVETQSPVTDLWQTWQITKRVAATEEGTDKVFMTISSITSVCQLLFVLVFPKSQWPMQQLVVQSTRYQK